MTSRSLFTDPKGIMDAFPGNPAQAAYAAASSLTANSVGFDWTLQNTTTGKAYSSALLVGQTGAVTGAPTSFTCTWQVQDSPDNSTWANYGDPLVLTAAASADALSVKLVDADRYVRVVCTVAFVGGTTPTLYASSAFAGVIEKTR